MPSGEIAFFLIQRGVSCAVAEMVAAETAAIAIVRMIRFMMFMVVLCLLTRPFYTYILCYNH